LRKEMRNFFVDLNHKEAFDLLFFNKEAMGNSNLPTVLDKLCMVTNINSRKLIEIIKAEIKLKETKIDKLSEMIDSLEMNITDHGRPLRVT
jgi:hypothetical protein